ncbi:DUF1538 family protein [Desulfonatronospira sp.]|uniref:DUF1538 family protein n=1 Tax=Desulfonatronospira sp. TaxID=1962951 RepID=UPI0025BD9D48|nr:DUF1538 family protein [Desulfonatronospira sp.]
MSSSSISLWSTLKTVLPVLAVLAVLEAFLGFLSLDGSMDLAAGAVMVVLGLYLFLNGVNHAVIPLGRAIGSMLPQYVSTALFLALALVFGLVMNAADPAVHILAGHVDSATGDYPPGPLTVVLIVAASIGVFIAMALLRILLGIGLKIFFGLGYGLVLILSLFVPAEFVPLAFDAGGIATGPLTVPFILAFGLGVVSVLGKSSDDSFGLLGLAAIGPILGIMLMGVLLQ